MIAIERTRTSSDRRKRRISSAPVISGIHWSTIAMSNGTSCAARHASGPEIASNASKPLSRSVCRRIVRTGSASSTTRIRVRSLTRTRYPEVG